MSNTDTAPTPPPPPGELGLHEAAQKIEAALFAPASKRKSNGQAPIAAEPAEEADYAESADETPPATGADDEPEPEEDGAAEEATTNADEEGDESSDEPLFTVKIDGKTQQVKQSELIAGYQKQVDYTRKTQALANERKAFEAETQHVAEERKQYAFLLSKLAEQLPPEGQDPDWVTYEATYGTATALKAKLQWEQQERRRQAIQSEQQRLQQIQSQEQVKAHEQFMHQAANYLAEQVPEWKDPKKYESDRVRLRQAGLKLGYTEDELSAVIDPRAVLMLRKAAAFDDLVSKKLLPRPTAEPAPPTARPGVPQTTQSRKTTELQRAKKRLAETGRVEDAAKVFERLLR